MKKLTYSIIILLLLSVINIQADASANAGTATALFLAIPADARSAAMGAAGTGRNGRFTEETPPDFFPGAVLPVRSRSRGSG